MINGWKLIGVLFCTFLIPLTVVVAQGPPINTDTPIMLGLEGRGVRTFVKAIRKGTLLSNGQEVSDSLNRTITAWIAPVVIPYNFLSDRLQMGVIVPYMAIGLDKISGDVSSTGLADMRVFAKYLLYQFDRKNKTIRVASKASVKLPTGDDDSQPALGTGTTDYFFTTVAGWVENRVGVFLEGIYNLNTSRDSLEFGNSFSYNLALGFRFLPAIYETYPSPQINGYLELNGTTVGKNEINGQRVDNSGGTTIFLSPGLQYIGGRRWLIEASFQYPFVTEPHGTQLATDWTLSFGTRILLF